MVMYQICLCMQLFVQSKDLTSVDNYRPVALVTAISKLFELCILSRIETLLVTSDLQIGFKRSHSTDMCIFALKEIVDFYKRQSYILPCSERVSNSHLR